MEFAKNDTYFEKPTAEAQVIKICFYSLILLDFYKAR